LISFTNSARTLHQSKHFSSRQSKGGLGDA
jgi:hypothetical protein